MNENLNNNLIFIRDVLIEDNKKSTISFVEYNIGMDGKAMIISSVQYKIGAKLYASFKIKELFESIENNDKNKVSEILKLSKTFKDDLEILISADSAGYKVNN